MAAPCRAAPDALDLVYDPLAFPTAQHGAGLAGLLVLRDVLARRGVGPLPSVAVDSAGAIRVTVSLATLQPLFDELFDATWEARTAPFAPEGDGVRNVRTEPVERDGRVGARYAYEALAPRAGWLADLGAPEPWQRVWREVVWGGVRSRSKQRAPYVERAAGRPSSAAADAWAALTRRLRGGAPYVVKLSGSLLLGAQAATADGVPMLATAANALILNFWPVVMLPGIVRAATPIGDRDDGYALIVPDVADPIRFAAAFPSIVAALPAEATPRGTRPRAAQVSSVREGCLEYLALVGPGARDAGVAGFEGYHLVRRGNGTPVQQVVQLAADPGLAERYAEIRDRYWSPLFRRQAFWNLVRDRERGGVPWYQGFADVFARHAPDLFVGDSQSAGAFGHDAGVALTNDIYCARLRARLTADGRKLTPAAKAFAASHECAESTVWEWLSGRRPVPKWLRREMDGARP